MPDETIGKDEAMMKAKSDALRLISFQARSSEELRTRMAQKKHAPAVIAEVIELFKRQGLIDDEKFARLFANSRVHAKPAGKRRLEAEMKKKGLKPDVISKTIEGLEGYDEKKMARELVLGRFQRMKDLAPQKKKARLFGFLARRGFRSDVIYSVVNDLFKDSETIDEG